jgi:hypothetical protein
MKNGMANIRKKRGVPAKRGRRVRWGCCPQTEGTITCSNGSDLYVKFDDRNHSRLCYPFDLDYLVGHEWQRGEMFLNRARWE